MFGVASTARANLPSVYAFSFVRAPPPNTATVAGPLSARSSRSLLATNPSASSQVAGRSEPSARSSGVVRRSGVRRRLALVHPFWHRPPRFVGNWRPETVTGLPPTGAAAASAASVGVSCIAHCSAQYGQCVAAATDIRPPPPPSPRHVGGRRPT